MPDIKLGLEGSETTLPKVNWNAGGDLEIPTGYKKNVDKSTMLDGSSRINLRSKHGRSFTLEWELLVLADVLTLKGIAEMNEPLRFQDNRIDATWKWVWVSSLEISTIESTFGTGTARYRVVMELEEIA